MKSNEPPTQLRQQTLFVSLFIVFLLDCLLPPGLSIWILYLGPIMLAVYTRDPVLPVRLATLGSLLILLKLYLGSIGLTDFFIAEEVAHAWVGFSNRGFGLLTVWAFALIARQLIRADQARERAAWLQAGQVTVHESMRGSQAVAQLGSSVLDVLTELLQARAASLFWASTPDHLIRVGSYGLDASALDDAIQLGEGLVGQVARDRKPLLLNDLPADYPKIRSDLGAAQPCSVLIFPIGSDHGLKAVVELAAFRRFAECDLELLHQVQESIAIAITAAEAKEQLQQALEETRIQAEELTSSNDELESQAERLRHQHEELENQQAELEQHARLLEASRLELETKNQELERVSRYKSEFLANVSHELRTPLNAILIFAKLLAEDTGGNLNADQRQYATTIHRAGSDLLELIGDILDLAKVEAGRLELSADLVRLSDVFQTLESVYGPIAGNRGLGFEIIGMPEHDAILLIDRKRLEQILRNLVANAVKFTEAGKISLSMCKHAGGIDISVTDTGIGISQDAQQLIFEAFRQADSGTGRKYGGTGLGLSICRELAELLGGRISLQSEKGRGSCFTLHLPHSVLHAEPAPTFVAPVPAPLPAKAPPELSAAVPADDREDLAPNDRVILVIEDDPSFASVLYNLAGELGFKCVLMNNAREGLNFALVHQPHAIVLDITLPESSGIWVLEQLKQTPSTRHIPVHIVSVSDYAQATLAMGAIGYLLKPVGRDELVAAFQTLEKRISRTQRRVLLVEDNEQQRQAVVQLIGQTNVEIQGVASGAEALKALAQHRFDCMILDLNLPDMSGFELLERMAEQAHGDSGPYPPVIVYTGRELSRQEEQQLLIHSQSIVIKGARSPERLLSEVTLFLHSVEAELSAECQQMLMRARAAEKVFDQRTLLIVDDDPRNVFALAAIFERRGARVISAKNGKDALARLKSDAPLPDLVLMDIMMPEMDGYQAIREIRRDPRLAKLPIIAVTAKAMKGDQAACLAAGANDYVAKPVDVERLIAMIRVHMPRVVLG